MTEPGLSLDEEPFSPDIFSDVDVMTSPQNFGNSDDSCSTSCGVNEPEPSDDVPEWKGMSMDEIRKGLSTYDCQELPPICPSSLHTVLIALPLPVHQPPKPYPTHQADKWCQGYVRMPHSTHSIYPIDQSGSRCRNRWEIIQESLLQSFVSSHQLETAILSYNHIYAQRWNFSALHHFFTEVIDEEETDMFFKGLMPKMVQLALQLPVLITGAVPLLKRHSNGTISLSQLQIASLLANAFFCTFPRRNSSNPQSEYGTYPHINFNRLFSSYKEGRHNRCEAVMEKMKCLFHYFRRVTSKAPEGVVTIQRRYIPKQDCPKWERQTQKLLPLHITSKGTIETNGAGLLQVDFANKYVGGGVLGLGCVQEEIRFVICPELLVTMLVTEALDDTEALVISGIERYSKYKGYSNNFKWMGDYVDETPRDSSRRRLTSIVAIDALYFKHPKSQFSISNITRELNKAYVGFVGCEGNKSNLPAVATGNWGCGAFRGDPKLKVLLQLMAAAVTGRSIVYFTFGDTNLRDDISEMYWHFVKNDISIGHIFSLLSQYQEFAACGSMDFYRFLYNRSKIKPLFKYFFVKPKSPETDTSKSKEVTFKRSKSLNDDRKRSQSGTDLNEEEDRIRSWLSNYEEDFVGGEKTETSKEKSEGNESKTEENKPCTPEEKRKNNSKNDEVKTDEDTEKRKNQSFWKMMEDKVQNKTLQSERRLSGLELLDAEEIIPHQKSDDRDKLITVNEQPIEQNSSKQNRKSETDQICNEYSKDTCKRNSPVKKIGQKKISDFFQRPS